MSFERGDLILIPVPFSNLSATKRRPVVLLTRPDALGDFIALAVTSRPDVGGGLPISDRSLVRGSLPKASWIRTDRVFTLNRAIVARYVATLDSDAVHTAVRRLCRFLGATPE